MPIHPRLTRPGILAVLTLLAFVPAAHAAWQPNGNPVCAAAGNQTAPVAIGDGAGGIYVAWLDSRPGTPGVYAQRLLPDGTVAAGFATDGVLLSGTTAAGAPRIVPDGAGGALILWCGNTAIYAQRLDASGALHAGWPANGMLVTSDVGTSGQAGYFDAAPDGAGGACFTREVLYFGPFGLEHRIRLTRITADGAFAAGWSESGVVLTSASQANVQKVTRDPLDNAWLVGVRFWNESGTQPWYGMVRRVNADGTLPWTVSCTNYSTGFTTDGVQRISTAPDGAGGAYMSWHTVGNGGSSLYYLGQRGNSAGTKQWTEPYNLAFSEHVVQDGASGAWFVGRPPGLQRLEVHRRLPDGSLPGGWTSAGVVISQPTALGQVAAEPFPDDVVVLCWSENTSGSGFDIRATSVRQDGVIPPGWDPGGSAVCSAAGDQINPVLVLQGASAFAAWEDRRNGTGNSDIYAMSVAPLGPVAVTPVDPGRFGIVGLAPVPARERVEVSFSSPGGEPVTVEIADVSGRTVLRQIVAGRSRAHLDLGGLDNGIYFLRASQGGRSASRRLAVLR